MAAAGRQDPNWNDLRYVLALSRAGSLAGAARALDVDATTVARRLRAVEAALPALLFHRLPDGTLQPTQVGETVLRHAESAETAMAELTAAASGLTAAPAGLVRVTAVPILVGRVLVPTARDLLKRYPALRLELVGDTRNLSLLRREADVALRLGRPAPDAGHGVLSRKLGHMTYAAYAPADCDPAMDATLPWVGYEDDMSALPQAQWLATAARQHGGTNLALNDAEALIQAIRSGVGRSILPRIVGDADAGLRRVQTPCDLPPVPVRDVWLLVHPELRPLARISAVVEWLSTIVAAFQRDDRDRCTR